MIGAIQDGQYEEEKDLVGPQVPADFLVKPDEMLDAEKVELFGDSYKRPRR